MPVSVGFEEDRVTVGRSSECDIQVPFQVISSHHLTFRRDGARYRVRDEASTNGTELDGDLVEPHVWYELSDGATLRVVDILIEVEFEGADREVDQFTLAQTGTMARRMLGDALDSAAEDLAYFEVVQGPNRGEQCPLPDDLEHGVVGSAPGCDVHVAGDDVALRAAVVRFDDRGFEIEATGETRVWLNDERLVEPARLSEGDRIAFDNRDLVFHDPLESHLMELEGLDEFAAETEDASEDDEIFEEAFGDTDVADEDHPTEGGDAASTESAPHDTNSEASPPGTLGETANGSGRQAPTDASPESDVKEMSASDEFAEADQPAAGEEPDRASADSGWGLTELILLAATVVFLALAATILAITFGLV